MTDIVERLRLGGPNAWEVVDEAATEIERLRATINAQSSAIERADRLVLACEQHLRDARHEITKLRTDLREAGIIR